MSHLYCQVVNPLKVQLVYDGNMKSIFFWKMMGQRKKERKKEKNKERKKERKKKIERN